MSHPQKEEPRGETEDTGGVGPVSHVMGCGFYFSGRKITEKVTWEEE